MKKIVRLTESDLVKLVKRVIQEQAAAPVAGETQVSGPFGDIPQYYVYEKNNKFFIYQTNASTKNPTLLGGTLWSNNGQGYNSKQEAEKVITSVLPSAGDQPGGMME